MEHLIEQLAAENNVCAKGEEKRSYSAALKSSFKSKNRCRINLGSANSHLFECNKPAILVRQLTFVCETWRPRCNIAFLLGSYLMHPSGKDPTGSGK